MTQTIPAKRPHTPANRVVVRNSHSAPRNPNRRLLPTHRRTGADGRRLQGFGDVHGEPRFRPAVRPATIAPVTPEDNPRPLSTPSVCTDPPTRPRPAQTVARGCWTIAPNRTFRPTPPSRGPEPLAASQAKDFHHGAHRGTEQRDLEAHCTDVRPGTARSAPTPYSVPPVVNLAPTCCPLPTPRRTPGPDVRTPHSAALVTNKSHPWDRSARRDLPAAYEADSCVGSGSHLPKPPLPTVSPAEAALPARPPASPHKCRQPLPIHRPHDPPATCRIPPPAPPPPPGRPAWRSAPPG